MSERVAGSTQIRDLLLERRNGADHFSVQDNVAVEEPLEIRIGDEVIATLMRTPGHDEELVAGFLLGEGIVRHREDLNRLDRCSHPGAPHAENVVDVFLGPNAHLDWGEVRRHFIASSSCGICSKTSIAALRQAFPRIDSSLSVSTETIYTLSDKLGNAQAAFARTGGLHACALFDETGHLLLLREDVGRHNAVDKIIGHAFLQDQLPLSRHILMVSGRVAFEIVQKALAAGLPLITAISAPTSLAVEFAHENAQTLIGFLRDRRMNIYTHPHRIRGQLQSVG